MRRSRLIQFVRSQGWNQRRQGARTKNWWKDNHRGILRGNDLQDVSCEEWHAPLLDEPRVRDAVLVEPERHTAKDQRPEFADDGLCGDDVLFPAIVGSFARIVDVQGAQGPESQGLAPGR